MTIVLTKRENLEANTCESQMRIKKSGWCFHKQKKIAEDC